LKNESRHVYLFFTFVFDVLFVQFWCCESSHVIHPGYFIAHDLSSPPQPYVKWINGVKRLHLFDQNTNLHTIQTLL